MVSPKRKSPIPPEPQTLSFAEFSKSPAAHLKKAKKAQRPTVLTQSGRPSLVLIDAGAYARLTSRPGAPAQDARLRRSVVEAERGQTRPMVDAINDLLKRYGA